MRTYRDPAGVLHSLPLLAVLLVAPAVAAEEGNGGGREVLELETVQVVDEYDRAPGAARSVDAEELERDEHDDLHRVLQSVPGVHFRGEDGHGLRPNIGLRGTTTERSQKINILEDGVLITPAPYSAPAAYYVPMVSRMDRVEVVTGPSAITHGPNTVGGTINLITRPIPSTARGGVDVATGSNDYRKAHVHYGDSGERLGYLFEGLHLETDGFKDLDGGGDTGFDKNNLMLKTRYNTDPAAPVYHQFDLKLNYADEESNETYLGLSDPDFERDPFRRYAASRRALMEWDHEQIALTHTLDFEGDWTLRTTAYRHYFDRSWRKLNRFDADRPLLEILRNPEAGLNADFLDVLQGDRDSDAAAGETLLIGTNARTYLSQGVQSTLDWRADWFDLDHRMTVGLRLHEDEIDRDHTEEGFLMRDGDPVPDGGGDQPLLFNEGSAQAISAFVQDEIRFDRLTLTAGLRGEHIEYDSRPQLPTGERQKNDNSVLLPAVGAFYQLTPQWGLLAGVHRGFVPTGPGQADSLDPEESINYEAGFRYRGARTSAEVIGFFTDYRNLKGACTFSTGCIANKGEAFSGGEVDVYGLEVLVGHEWSAGDWRFPLSLAYSFTQTEFRSSFESDFPLWNEVEAGDELPYMPEHRLTLSLGVARPLWDLTVTTRYVDDQLEQAGRAGVDDGDGPLAGAVVDGHAVMDVVGRYRPGGRHSFYGKVGNLLDEDYLISRRPFGARPGRPLSLQAGYKYLF